MSINNTLDKIIADNKKEIFEYDSKPVYINFINFNKKGIK